MTWKDIEFDPPRKTLRQFAGIWLLFFGGWALWLYFGKGEASQAAKLAGLAVAVGLPGLAYPPLVRWIFVGASVATFPIGWVVSRLVLGIVFYLLITPMGFLFRLKGRDVLCRRKRATGSYWIEKRTPENASSYLKQY